MFNSFIRSQDKAKSLTSRANSALSTAFLPNYTRLPPLPPKLRNHGRHVINNSTTASLADSDMDYDQLRQINGQTSLDACLSAVEEIVDYNFREKKLIDAALPHPHPSHTDLASYQRLELIGDAALELALADFVFLAYPSLEPGQLSLLRAANISTEKLARVAVKHGLYRFVRHNAPALDEKVVEFAQAV